MRVNIVCRYNQARSIISAAAVRSIFPKLNVFSSGVDAVTNTPIPIQVKEIADLWKLDQIEDKSINLDDSPNIDGDDLIICADSFVYEQVLRRRIDAKIINLDNYAYSRKLHPSDPKNLPFGLLEKELIKMIITTVRALESESIESTNIFINSLICFKDQIERSYSKILNWLKLSDGILIDMNWQVPDASLWQELSLPKHTFDLREILNSEFQLHNKSINCSRYEVDNPMKYLLSQHWYEFLNKSSKPILLIVPCDESTPSSPNIAALIHSRSTL